MIEIKKERCDPEYHSYNTENFSRKQINYNFKSAIVCLSEDYEPEQILCRDEEIDKIKSYIKEFINTGYAK